ncbi:MAG: PilZ domain-containing protein [Candidatus Omnitrophica bacterium]|nr:PilZ domain-containing protein [Candidatus Omnitrophota bacterium]
MADKGYRYENTRQWVRLPCDWYVKYQVEGKDTPETLVTAKDVSASGIRLETRETVEMGSIVHLKINANVAPLRKVLEVKGKIIRMQEISPESYEWGIQFEGMGEPEKAELNRRIESLAGRERLSRHRGQWWRRI